ncbi:MAG TPA: dihydrofolate reductase family protein [Abditibacteriaceae bacterium]|nr:dihydrofolate reductase family protein [Abditibacteriaceae bacterium]
MRKLIATTFLSLDGVMEEPSWMMPYRDDETGRFKRDELQSADALLLGRVTYEGFAAHWPASTDEWWAARMNPLPKFVASNTLSEATWNAQIIRGDLAAEVARLKARDGKDILIYGSADLIASLLPHNLIDEFRLMICPVVLGGGKRLFHSGTPTTLQLIEAQTFASGAVALIYRPASPA